MDKGIVKFYRSLLERESYLRGLEKTDENIIRLNECLLSMVTLQKIILDNLKKENRIKIDEEINSLSFFQNRMEFGLVIGGFCFLIGMGIGVCVV